MEDDLDRLSRSKKVKEPDPLEGRTLRRETGEDILDEAGTITPAQSLVLELRNSKGETKRWCLIDAHLEGHNFVIGRSPECDIPYWWFTGTDVQLSKISRRHAALRVVGEHFYGTDLDSKNGTFVSGKQIGKEAVAIEDGHEVDLGGEFAFRIRKVLGPGLQCIVLQTVKPKASMGVCVLIASAATIGRDAGCAIIIDDSTILDRHATVVLRDGSFWLKSRDEKAQVFVNGKILKINETAKIRSGDTISLGKIRITIQDYDPKSEIQGSLLSW